MLHHVSVGTNDLARSRAFYDAVLSVFGLRRVKTHEKALDYGNGSNAFLFSVETPLDGEPATAGNGVHICFAASERSVVDAFHRAGIESGGRDAGKPGIRADYDPNYYGAFLFDPDGNKIEAVTYQANHKRYYYGAKLVNKSVITTSKPCKYYGANEPSRAKILAPWPRPAPRYCRSPSKDCSTSANGCASHA